MRTAGSVIWATDLLEHAENQGGKAAAAIMLYSYTANLAVALASRPILDIGRIWADGKLLRGVDGALKVGGTLRIHRGAGDQAADPLIAAAEGEDRCPAYRDLAYVVFEDLDLSEFYNRIPSLSFEIIADETFDLQAVIGEVLDSVDASVPLEGVAGYTGEGSLALDLQTFDQVIPLEVDSAGDGLVIARERHQTATIALPEPAVATDDDAFGAATGFARNRAAPDAQIATALRYYDLDRDYQASVQRAAFRPGPGEPGTIELPAALDSATARALIERTARRLDWTRERISWRTAELDPAIGPGAIVSLPAIAGRWRVREWEWRAAGVELSLERAVPTGADVAPALSSDPGRANPPLDASLAQTRIIALELPYDASASADVGRPCAAVSATTTNWTGAALFADRGDGQLLALGPSGRTRAVIGTAISALPAASPLLFDRAAQLVVTLADSAMQLASADTRQLAQGANLAMVGKEIVQFARATALGDGSWRLDGLLRGQGGTEAAIGGHVADEPFVLLASGLVALDPSVLGADPDRQVLALGRGDGGTPVAASVHLSGIAQRPLSPVHPRKSVAGDGGWTLSWVRRARGGWDWSDGVDVPLVEQSESYLVTVETGETTPAASWATTTPALAITPATLAQLASLYPGAPVHVRQQGTHALSPALLLCTLP
jgi:hypothetical protein